MVQSVKETDYLVDDHKPSRLSRSISDEMLAADWNDRFDRFAKRGRIIKRRWFAGLGQSFPNQSDDEVNFINLIEHLINSKKAHGKNTHNFIYSTIM